MVFVTVFTCFSSYLLRYRNMVNQVKSFVKEAPIWSDEIAAERETDLPSEQYVQKYKM